MARGSRAGKVRRHDRPDTRQRDCAGGSRASDADALGGGCIASGVVAAAGAGIGEQAVRRLCAGTAPFQ